MNSQYLAENHAEFLKLWWELLKQNPSIYIKAYLMETSGFWNVDVSASDGYVQNFLWSEDWGVTSKDYFEDWFGFSFQHFVNPRNYISCAWFFGIFVFAAWFLVKHYGWKSIFIYTPQLGVCVTLMVAVPMAVSLRYIASLMFTLPFVVIVPLMLERSA